MSNVHVYKILPEIIRLIRYIWYVRTACTFQLCSENIWTVWIADGVRALIEKHRNLHTEQRRGKVCRKKRDNNNTDRYDCYFIHKYRGQEKGWHRDCQNSIESCVPTKIYDFVQRFLTNLTTSRLHRYCQKLKNKINAFVCTRV